MYLNRLPHLLLSFVFIAAFSVYTQADEAPWGPNIIKLGDITISCEAYDKYYRDIVEDAAKNNSPKWNAAAKSRLDEAFGTYKTAWIKGPDWIVDMYGKKLPTHKSINDIKCYSNSNYGGWDSDKKPYTYKKETSSKIRLGYIDDCKIMVNQDIWPELGECGTGTIIRNFEIGVWCGSRDYTLKLTQKIHVVPSCSFSKEMLHVPDVQWMCAPIVYEDNNHIKLPDYIKPVTLYNGWESSCHSSKVYVSHYDKMYKMIQETRKYVIIRTWVFSDKCTGKKIEAEQKIMVDGLCRDDDPDFNPDEPDKGDKDTVQYALLNNLEDIHISYETYSETYKDVVDLALETYRKGNADLSAELLNAIFGKYQIQSDTVEVDSVTVYSMDCNNGNPIDSEYKIKNGVLQADCPSKLTIDQKLSEEYTNCGATALRRQFIVESKCDSIVMRDTLVQRIVFSPTCALSADVFEVPSDTVLCGTLERDSNNRYILPIDDQPVYVGDSMRSFEVDYKFYVAYSSDDPNRTEVSRVWTYTDTCADETTMLTQEIVLMDTCQAKLEKSITKEIVRTVSKENIERGISEVIKKLKEDEIHLDKQEAYAFPNPFTQNVGVTFYQRFTGKAQIRILDSRGQFLTQKDYELNKGNQQINLSGGLFKVPGMYIVQVISGEQIENLRVMYQAIGH